jgi:phosphatidylinositol alpha-mannosyltransferase
VRIAIASEYARPWPGGISEHVHHEAALLAAQGHAVGVWTGPGAARRAAPDSGLGPGAGGAYRVERFRFALRFVSNGAASRLVADPRLLALRRSWRAARVDLVHVHAPLDPLLGWAAVLASPVPVVGTFHASFEPGPLWELLYRRLRGITGRVFERLAVRTAVSAEAERSIARYFPGDYQQIPNGVDLARFRPDLPPPPGLEEPRPRLLFVGRADPRKGLALLFAALPELLRREPALELVAVGVGAREAQPMIAGLAAPLRAALRFEGYVAPELLPRYYAACDVFCSPALGQESQGIVLLEALASGTPPVVFDIPGYRDVVCDGRDARVVREREPKALAAAIAELFERPELRARLAAAGRVTAAHYAWPAVVRRLEACFESARASRGGGR